jgi:hypothetical protein
MKNISIESILSALFGLDLLEKVAFWIVIDKPKNDFLPLEMRILH